MAKKLYVGNLPFTATEQEIRTLFAQHGTIVSVNLITDRSTGQPRGFGFVEMEDTSAAKQHLDGHEMDGRALRVNDAEEKRSTGSSSGSGRNW